MEDNNDRHNTRASRPGILERLDAMAAQLEWIHDMTMILTRRQNLHLPAANMENSPSPALPPSPVALDKTRLIPTDAYPSSADSSQQPARLPTRCTQHQRGQQVEMPSRPAFVASPTEPLAKRRRGGQQQMIEIPSGVFSGVPTFEFMSKSSVYDYWKEYAGDPNGSYLGIRAMGENFGDSWKEYYLQQEKRKAELAGKRKPMTTWVNKLSRNERVIAAVLHAAKEMGVPEVVAVHRLDAHRQLMGMTLDLYVQFLGWYYGKDRTKPPTSQGLLQALDKRAREDTAKPGWVDLPQA